MPISNNANCGRVSTYFKYYLHRKIISSNGVCGLYRSEVAKRLNRDSYGLVFGFNTFIALFLHTVITYGVVQGHFISVTTIQQVNK